MGDNPYRLSHFLQSPVFVPTTPISLAFSLGV